MKFSGAVVVAAALLQACVAQVHVLTSKNFKQQVLDSSDYWLVECGHCKQLEPEWKEAAKQLKTKAKLGKVDCTVHQDLGQTYGIQGYPTIKGRTKIFPRFPLSPFSIEFGKNKKKPKDFNGGRRASEIVQYVRSNPHAGLFEHVDLLTYTTMQPFLESQKLPKVVVLGRNKQKKGKSLKGPLIEPQPLPVFPPREDASPKKKPPIGAVQQLHASTFESLCLAGGAKMCVVYLPSSMEFDLKPAAKQFRRDPLRLFYIHPEDVGFHSQLAQWLDLPKTTAANRALVFKTGTQVRMTDLADVRDTAALENQLTQVLDGLHPFRPVMTAPFEPAAAHTEEL
ncbi:hypothetical protein DYB26_000634 [Aphanomyces astaci]|uniref:Thioredoxin domain-containing protein n=1 Tax=Aphanomyces astaci TaxID=112090 RepID=A0A397D9U4_APHAT|nr:hypothetical protein DYB38_005138 [Aphanomyces astaci]RHY80322.1 hypothetical protein DYB31_008369 [Aphanomyces astaci]RHZ27987.1 hypothetical protein DYB26_000634 [Aphanomyces astaci]